MARRAWYHRQFFGGDGTSEAFADDTGGQIITPVTGSPYVTVLRTRLSVWAWWASNDLIYPGVGQYQGQLRVKVQYAWAETGSMPPPTDWPDDPNETDGEGIQPCVYAGLDLAAEMFVPADPVAGLPRLYYGAAQLSSAAGDSQAKRRFDDTYVISSWVALGQYDWAGGTGGLTGIPFYCRGLLSTLVESP